MIVREVGMRVMLTCVILGSTAATINIQRVVLVKPAARELSILENLERKQPVGLLQVRAQSNETLPSFWFSTENRYQIYPDESREFNDKFNTVKTFTLKSTEKFDREQKSVYNLNFEIFPDDDSSTGASSWEQVFQNQTKISYKLNIEDLNDNPPEFPTKVYIFHVEENSPAGTEIGQVKATDKDVGENARLTFELAGSENLFKHLVIDSFSGKVFVKEPIDGDELDTLIGEVIVRDNGEPGQLAHIYLRVYVKNINDCYPVLDSADVQFNVSQNANNLDLIGKIKANDCESGSKLDFESWMRWEDGLIMTRDGRIYVTEQDKLVAGDKHRFPVTITDSGKPPLTTTANVTINVV